MVSKETKDALMHFSETVVERAPRVGAEWKHVGEVRGMNALEFETRLVKRTAQLEWMPLSDKENTAIP